MRETRLPTGVGGHQDSLVDGLVETVRYLGNVTTHHRGKQIDVDLGAENSRMTHHLEHCGIE